MSDQELMHTEFENEEELTSNVFEERTEDAFEEWSTAELDENSEENKYDLLIEDEMEEDSAEKTRLRREMERKERALMREEKRNRRIEKERKQEERAKHKLHKNGEEEEDASDMPVIQFCNVTKDYENYNDDKMALEDVSFEIRKGEFVFIVGPSGSGKSTMIRLMMKEISPTEGTIFVAGRDLSRLRKNQVARYRREIGIVFQDFRLLNDRNVYENVAFAQQVIGQPKRKIPREVAKMLALVGLSNKYKNRPTELSGGEQQRVALARALVNNPTILLADEPTGNLDPQNSWEIMNLLEEINRRGTTVVVVTHNSEIVDQMQKRVITVRDGSIEEDKKGGYVIG